MPFDYINNLTTAFKNNIYSSSTEIERKKEIIKLSITALSKKPERIVGFLRFQGVKQKLIQFLTQSLEIKTGDMLEEFFTYLFGYQYTNLPKYIRGFKCDQLFKKEENDTQTIYLIEQKIRDDHDSSKKDGQVANFENKINVIHSEYPNAHVVAYEWFIDDSFKKYPGYYKDKLDNFLAGKNGWLSGDVCYGGNLIDILCGDGSWQQFVESYNAVKMNYVSDIGTIIRDYDFDVDPDNVVFDYLKIKRDKSFKVFFDESYSEVRQALFPQGLLEKRLFNYFSNKNTITAHYFVSKYNEKHGGN